MLNNEDARGFIRPVVEPIARSLLKLHVTPDAITILGTILTTAVALTLLPQGRFALAVVLLMVLTTSDLLDGTMARLSGTSGPWGNWLDSTLDRVGDGAIFGGLLIWAAWNHEAWTTAMAWACLVFGTVISYAKARAESVGAHANVGIAERAERMILAALGALGQQFGVPHSLAIALTVLAVLNLITVFQRASVVRAQLKVPAAGGDG
ncbi:MAG: phosphatidylinositol phosphate synthase [Candidatus Nanopelagicales bacterium]